MNFKKENIRISLLGCIMTMYVFFGAVIIKQLESPFEKKMIQNYLKLHKEFEEKLVNRTAGVDELKTLLYMYGNVTAALGAPGRNERWNLLGSLCFVVTIVTTIGYGSYTPNTAAGKVFVILYGFIGCAGGILFFNLFLERMITFFVYVLRRIYVRKVTRNKENNSVENIEQLLAEWKPSIHSVMFCLFMGVVSIGFVAIPAYSQLEGWSYVEAAYFCFVSFSTIGFGDFVAAQRPQHTNFYVLANIIIIALGCCFVYSIFNVISIVLKQLLNWIIIRMETLSIRHLLLRRKSQSNKMLRKYSLRRQGNGKATQSRRCRIRMIRRTVSRKGRRQSMPANEIVQVENTSSGSAIRKTSDDGLVSMKDIFISNKVSLALMPKQLGKGVPR